MRVDLPAPLTPSRPMRWPAWRIRLRSFRTTLAPSPACGGGEWVPRRHVLQYQQGVGRPLRFPELEAEGGGGVDGGQLLHLRQHLHAGLGLLGLAGLGLEAVDEGLQVGPLPALLLEGGLAQGQVDGPLLFELGVVAAVTGELLLVDVGDDVHHPVQEVPVVGDDDQRARVALEPVLQPEDGVQVQVVGGLVQQQQVGRAHEGLGQVEAHAPAAGEAGHRLGHLGLGEAQAGEELLAPGLHRVGVGVLEGGVEFADAVAVMGGFRFRQFRFQTAQGGVAVDGVVQGGALQGRGLLGHVGDAPAGGKVQIAPVRVQLAPQEGEQAGLARAVGADEAHLLPRVEGEVGPLQQGLGAPDEGEGLEADQSRALPMCSPRSYTTWARPTSRGSSRPMRAASLFL